MSEAAGNKGDMQSMHAYMMAASWKPKCDTCGTDSESIHYFKDFSSEEGSLECGWCRPDYMLRSQLDWNILGAPVPENFLQVRCTRAKGFPYPLPPFPLPIPPRVVPRIGEEPVYPNFAKARVSKVSFCKVMPIPAPGSIPGGFGLSMPEMPAAAPPPPQPAATDFRAQGNGHYAAGRLEQAIESYTKALEAGEAERHLILGNRAQARLKKGGMAEEALADAQMALQAAPNGGKGWIKGRYRVAMALREYPNIVGMTESVGLRVDGNAGASTRQGRRPASCRGRLVQVSKRTRSRRCSKGSKDSEGRGKQKKER